MTPEQLSALEEYQRAIDEYTSRDAENYLPEYMADTNLKGVTTDPKYKEYELQALRALEEQAKDGFTAQDRAAMARTETDVNRANRGRIGAIQQNMQSRGISGSGLDLVAQMQSAQDANEIAAMRALERDALGADRRSQGAAQLGNLSSQLQGRDFEQQARKATAQDQINQFNTQNRNNASTWNIENRQNWAGNKMQAKTGLGQMKYNAATEEYNQALARDAEERRKRQGVASGVLGAIGGVAGGVLGSAAGPLGTAAGASAGAQAGAALGSAFAYGGRIPGEPTVPYDSPVNDTVTFTGSPGETILPLSASKDPIAAANYVAKLNLLDENSFAPVTGPMPKEFAEEQSKPDLNILSKDPFANISKSAEDQAPPVFSKYDIIQNSAVRKYFKNKELEDQQKKSEIENDINQAFPDKQRQNPFPIEEKKDFDYVQFFKDAKDRAQKENNRNSYMALGDIFGQLATDYFNSQQPNTILANNFQNLGEAPKIIPGEHKQWKPIRETLPKESDTELKSAEMALKYRDQDLDRETKEKTLNAYYENQIYNQMDKDAQMRYLMKLKSEGKLSDSNAELLDYLVKEDQSGFKKSEADRKNELENIKIEQENQRIDLEKKKLERDAAKDEYQQKLDALKMANESGNIDKKNKAEKELLKAKQTFEAKENALDRANAVKLKGIEGKNLQKAEQSKPLSEGLLKRYDDASSALDGIRKMKAALLNPKYKVWDKQKFLSDTQFTFGQKLFVEGFGRLQSGGAISKDEDSRFTDFTPGTFENKNMALYKLNEMEKVLLNVQNRVKANQRGEPFAEQRNTKIPTAKDVVVEYKDKNGVLKRKVIDRKLLPAAIKSGAREVKK
jgi:hypothetical protein